MVEYGGNMVVFSGSSISKNFYEVLKHLLNTHHVQGIVLNSAYRERQNQNKTQISPCSQRAPSLMWERTYKLLHTDEVYIG